MVSKTLGDWIKAEPPRLHSSRVIPLWVKGDPPYRITVAEDGLDFGSVLLGTPKTQAIHITNSGFHPMHITTVTLTGNAAFSLPTIVDMKLSAGEVLELPVVFTPTVYGPVLGHLDLTFDNTDPVSLRVKGSGVNDLIGLVDRMLNNLFGFLQRATLPALTTAGPLLSLSTTNIKYVDEVVVNGFSPVTEVVISNPGTQPLLLTDILITGEFEIVP